MRIVLVNRFFFPDYSATSQLLSDLAFFLSESGATVLVVTSGQGYEDAMQALPPKETIRGVQVYRVRDMRFGRGRLVGRLLDYLAFYLGASWTLSRLIGEGDVVVAKTDPPLMGVPVSFVCALRRAAFVNWLQDLFPEVARAAGIRGSHGRFVDWLRKLRNSSIERSTFTAVIGQRMKTTLVNQGVSAHRLVMIPNWADGESIRPLLKSYNDLIPAWGLSNKFVVSYSGNLGRVHELATILDAMDVLRSDDRIEFLFIGGGKRSEWLQQEVWRRGIANVQFRPYQPRERLNLSLGVADVHLVTLLPEMEGLVVPSKFYGVAAAGRPTIFVGDPDGEIARVVEAESCGLTVRSGDSQALVEAISGLRDKPELVQLYGRNARAVFEARFSKVDALNRWKRLLDDAEDSLRRQ